MDQYEWLVFTCRACRKTIKLSPAMAGSSVVCPFCRTKVSVPDDAPLIKEKASHTAIPTSRSNDDNTMSQLRGPKREDWEVGKRPIGGELPFRDRLHSTAAPELQPDAPGQPDVHRVNMRRRKHEQTHEDFDDPERSSGRRKSRHKKLRSKGQRFGNTMVRGLIVAVVLLSGAVAWLGWQQYHKPKPGSSKPAFVQRETVTLEPSPDGPKLETRSMAEYGPALRDAVRRFLTAPTVDEMLKLVRDHDRVEPKIRAWYGEANPWKPVEVRGFEPGEIVEVSGEFIKFDLDLPNFEKIPIGLERNGNTFLVDWECFVGYGDMTWDQLMKDRPQQPVLMRVILEYSPETDYFNGVFSDSSRFHCYRIRDRKSAHALSGYCQKESPLDTVIRRNLRLEAPPSNIYSAHAVIRLRYPASGSSNNQVEITEFLEHGWVFRPDNK